jgi:hypothetical protein
LNSLRSRQQTNTLIGWIALQLWVDGKRPEQRIPAGNSKIGSRDSHEAEARLVSSLVDNAGESTGT